MINFILQLSLVCIAISMLILIYRVIKGPSIPDRVMALDAIGMNLICMIAILSLLLSTSMFLEVILLISILSFTGTVAFSKFLEKGEIIENERN
ncbi:Na(+)/H(+) antiporter subunit F1 [Pradoshia sp. D12]|jgi:multicomponent Na+:H+ antiporter subunit F|uniref:Na(+)/H(+) antiporter subunit F1 n=1 Tax=Bacillaceae TaxID=186817 RepID=UPI00080ACA61|nr:MULTISPECIES: Na(+)/H(+) antiporter subunit F1 [Bacillaceae]OCA84863.1 Na(+)/H(+) antiporter subunit F [Bacillus sp. FJAT-27986]QFK72666.1 Na(+)/H(+) antiporter subunit F1 [Pradoshia sp. D12]TPF71660.1 Na(+)/H(+) antiporter subunit F1 [Bacillus sp. D12]